MFVKETVNYLSYHYHVKCVVLCPINHVYSISQSYSNEMVVMSLSAVVTANSLSQNMLELSPLSILCAYG